MTITMITDVQLATSLKGAMQHFRILRNYRLERIPIVTDLRNTRSFFTTRNRNRRKK